MTTFHATTICAVRRGPEDIAIGGDGQVTMGETAIMKNGAKKVKKIFHGRVLTGFAGSVADAFALTEKFEKKLEEHGGNLKRAAVDLAQLWRSDKRHIYRGRGFDARRRGAGRGPLRQRLAARRSGAVCAQRAGMVRAGSEAYCDSTLAARPVGASNTGLIPNALSAPTLSLIHI